MHPKIAEKFEELHEDARQSPERRCRLRANSLAETMEEAGIPEKDIKKLTIIVKSDERLLHPAHIDEVSWRYHKVIELNGYIYDPTIGYPLEKWEYLNTAFKDENTKTLDVQPSDN